MGRAGKEKGTTMKEKGVKMVTGKGMENGLKAVTQPVMGGGMGASRGWMGFPSLVCFA